MIGRMKIWEGGWGRGLMEKKGIGREGREKGRKGERKKGRERGRGRKERNGERRRV